MLAFQAASPAVDGASVSSLTITWPGTFTAQLLIAVLGFEGVLAAGGGGTGSFDGGWVASIGDGVSTHGWIRACLEPPSADGGNGLEVWYLWSWDAGPTTQFNFDAARTAVAQGAVYTGQLDSAGALRAATAAQVTGDDPAAPSIYAYVDELLVACAADQLQSPGYGTPTPAGWTKRFDNARASTYGNVEITLADAPVTVEGDSGTIPWAATAAAAGTKGATATLAIRPTAAVVAATSPLIAVEFATS